VDYRGGQPRPGGFVQTPQWRPAARRSLYPSRLSATDPVLAGLTSYARGWLRQRRLTAIPFRQSGRPSSRQRHELERRHAAAGRHFCPRRWGADTPNVAAVKRESSFGRDPGIHESPKSDWAWEPGSVFRV
jgi:hypothetical protein